jgi:hypothetical protein
MKRIVIIAAVFLLAGCKPSPQVAVQKVMDTYRVDYTGSLRPQKFFGKPQPPVADLKALSGSLTPVDTSACPADFKAAWIAYVESLTATKRIGPADLLSLGMDGGAILAAKVVSNAAQNHGNQANAYEALSLVAASYGVTKW